MKTLKWRYSIVPVAFLGLSTAMAGCGEDGLTDGPLGDIAAQCGLTCDAKGILEGNASISGNASVDAFFGAVVDFKGAAEGLAADVQAKLDAIAVSVGLEPGAAAADIKGAIQAKLAANVDGGLQVNFQPPKCSASVEVTANAAAACDASVDPGSVEVACEGTCTIDASVQADCHAAGGLTCSGTLPGVKCEGTCTGECQLKAGVACNGKCNGTCKGSTDAGGNCQGECDGTCEVQGSADCESECHGTCEFTPPDGRCDAKFEAKCSATAEANIKCKGGCDGKVNPPSVSAECKATVEAKASANAQCTPPELDIAFQWHADIAGDANAQAQFRGWLTGFKANYAGLLAASAKAQLLAEAGANLGTSGKAAVEGFVDGLKGSANLKASIGAVCALTELQHVPGLLTEATGKVQASITAVAEIGTGIQG